MKELMENAERPGEPDICDERLPALRAGARVLLAHMLAQIDWYRDAPLTFEVDHSGIAAEAWKTFSAEWIASHEEGLPSWREMLQALNSLAALLLMEHGCPAFAQPADESAERGDAPGLWVARLQLAVRSADACGPKILKMLAEGFSCRDAARRLDLGLQMTRRIVDDIRAAWLAGEPEEKEPC